VTFPRWKPPLALRKLDATRSRSCCGRGQGSWRSTRSATRSRIIYGPEYTVPENLDRLRSRALGAKRSLALREFALGIEALERFVRREPLRRVHECVFGVLALESEPVDPRL
jgi:PNKP adenylyltransferase domain, C-terminal region